MSEEGGEMARRGGALPDDDNLLREIFLRLPPQPSSLPRASAVCKRWRLLVTDPKFLQCFRARHGKPPLLGVFSYLDKPVFSPILDPPDRISPERFSLSSCSCALRNRNHVLGCRHGRVLLRCPMLNEFVVCDPISSEERRVAAPPEFEGLVLNGAVVCAAGDEGHVHGDCHSSHFKVVLVSMHGYDHQYDDDQPVACVYSSETGMWGDLISTTESCQLYDPGSPATLVGNALYWLQFNSGDPGILEFDLDVQSLSLITEPDIGNDFYYGSRQIIQVEDGDIGLVIFYYHSIKIWHRKVNCHGVATWLVHKTVDMHSILGLPPQLDEWDIGTIMGYAEDSDAIFICVDSNVYMVQLKSMQSKRLHDMVDHQLDIADNDWLTTILLQVFIHQA
ncbi:hypothetical protein BRADI_2g01207v3 [Brachypodium distachyon]|uniref:Uncharacterized protein n=1 Tax=Brachypodium distachyon TaxID=15368 RepID=A0A0Q3JVA9_BRADI|nr:hypothetical protein BRADI_2g01207v3 [Brachypodium distachyon]